MKLLRQIFAGRLADTGPEGRVFSRFRRETQGLAAIEFALILPIAVLLMAGTVDLGESLTVNRRLNQIATATSDIVAQESSWTSASVANLLDGAATMIEPYSSDGLVITLAVVNISNTGAATVAWSKSYGGTALTAGTASPIDIPSSIAVSGVQLVTVTVDYEMVTGFTSLLSKFTGHTSYNLYSKSISRPRVGDGVSLT